MSEAFHDHFSIIASRYAEFRPHYPPALFDYLATLVPHDELVWDCACGNGQASTVLAERFHRVIGTDASAEQIRAAKPNPRVEYRVAPAELSGLPDESTGLVTVAQALHWFDLPRFHAEVKRVLRPGGVIAAWAYGVTEIEDAEVHRLVHDFYTNVVGPYWPPERMIVEAGYRTISFPFCELAPPPFCMEARWNLDQLVGYLSTWSATTRYIKATGQNPIEPLAEAVSHAWGDATSPRRVMWPLALRVGRK